MGKTPLTFEQVLEAGHVEFHGWSGETAEGVLAEYDLSEDETDELLETDEAG